jgi:hypothetical protein
MASGLVAAAGLLERFPRSGQTTIGFSIRVLMRVVSQFYPDIALLVNLIDDKYHSRLGMLRQVRLHARQGSPVVRLVPVRGAVQDALLASKRVLQPEDAASSDAAVLVSTEHSVRTQSWLLCIGVISRSSVRAMLRRSNSWPLSCDADN